jgi:ATP-dependent RNA helicase DDX24/MAK5
LRVPIALILSPTRELAHQLSIHLNALFDHSTFTRNSPSIATLTGGLSLQKQKRLLAKADIVIGTPGRLWEIISEGKGLAAWLKKIKFLVVDEADRLLSEGHFKELEEILNALEQGSGDVEENSAMESDQTDEHRPGTSRQTLVFSATFHKGLRQKLSGKRGYARGDLMSKKESMEYLLKKLQFREEKPKFIDVNPVEQMAERLKEGLVECAALEKASLSMLWTNVRFLELTSTFRISISTLYSYTTQNKKRSSSQTQYLQFGVLPTFSKISVSLSTHFILK